MKRHRLPVSSTRPTHGPFSDNSAIGAKDEPRNAPQKKRGGRRLTKLILKVAVLSMVVLYFQWGSLSTHLSQIQQYNVKQATTVQGRKATVTSLHKSATTKRDSNERYLLYYSHSGFGNQITCLINAANFALATNRTLVLAPVLPHTSFGNVSNLLFPGYAPRVSGTKCWPYDMYYVFIKLVKQDAIIASISDDKFPSFMELYNFDNITQLTRLRIADMPEFATNYRKTYNNSWCGSKQQQKFEDIMVPKCKKSQRLNFTQAVSRFREICGANESVAVIGSPFIMPQAPLKNNNLDEMSVYFKNELIPSQKMLYLMWQIYSKFPKEYAGVAIRFKDGMIITDCNTPVVRDAYNKILTKLATKIPIKSNVRLSKADNENELDSNFILIGASHESALRCFRHHMNQGNYTANVSNVNEIVNKNIDLQNIFNDIQSEKQTIHLLRPVFDWTCKCD